MYGQGDILLCFFLYTCVLHYKRIEGKICLMAWHNLNRIEIKAVSSTSQIPVAAL